MNDDAVEALEELSDAVSHLYEYDDRLCDNTREWLAELRETGVWANVLGVLQRERKAREP